MICLNIEDKIFSRPLSPRDRRERLESVTFHRKVLDDLDKMDEEDYPSGNLCMWKNKSNIVDYAIIINSQIQIFENFREY